MSTRQISFAIQGLSCAQCAMKVQAHLTRLEGVIAASVNYASERATVIFNPALIRPGDLIRTVHVEGATVLLEQVQIGWRAWRDTRKWPAERIVSARINWREGRFEFQVIPQAGVEPAHPLNLRSLAGLLLHKSR